MIESDYLKDNIKFVQKLGQMPTLKPFEEEDLKGLLRLSEIRKYEPGELTLEDGLQLLEPTAASTLERHRYPNREPAWSGARGVVTTAGAARARPPVTASPIAPSPSFWIPVSTGMTPLLCHTCESRCPGQCDQVVFR